MIEQYNNMVTVEPYESMDTSTNNDEVSNTMNSQSTNGYSQKISQGIGLLLIHLGILLIILGLGSNLLFFILSTKLKDENSKKSLFELMFSTNSTNSQKGGGMVGGNNLEKIKKYLKLNDIAEKCHEFENKFSRPDLSFNNLKFPGIIGWFKKANNDTNLSINNSLNDILNLPPEVGNVICSLSILFGIIFYIIFIILALIVLPLIFHFINFIHILTVGSDLTNKVTGGISGWTLTGGIIIYILFNVLFFLVNYVKSIYLLLKMLFYPLVLDGGVSLLRILQNNMFIVKLITIIVSIFYVSFLSGVVEQTTYIGVWIAYLPILLYTIKNLLNKSEKN